VTQDIPIHAFGVSILVLRPEPPRLSQGDQQGPGEGWRVLLLRRAGDHLPGVWSQVAGGIEAGERAWQAALRELAEETALVPLDFFSGDICEQYYDHEVEGITIFPVFVALVAAGAEPTLNHEHSEYTWATRAEAEALLPFAGQRNTLRHVWAEFVDRQPLEYLRIPIPDLAA